MEKNKPIMENKIGRFSVSLWRNTRVIKADDEKCRPEREIENLRVCVSRSKYSWAKRAWENQRIWCEVEELRDLANAIDGLVAKE